MRGDVESWAEERGRGRFARLRFFSDLSMATVRPPRLKATPATYTSDTGFGKARKETATVTTLRALPTSTAVTPPNRCTTAMWQLTATYATHA